MGSRKALLGWSAALALVSATSPVLGDPPDGGPPRPPVHHTNQGRTAEDDKPKIGGGDFVPPVLGDDVPGTRWIPPTTGDDRFESPLNAPIEFPTFTETFVQEVVTVTPAPATLTLLGLAGLGLCKRRRDQFGR